MNSLTPRDVFKERDDKRAEYAKSPQLPSSTPIAPKPEGFRQRLVVGRSKAKNVSTDSGSTLKGVNVRLSLTYSK